MKALMQCSRQYLYSISASARPSNESETFIRRAKLLGESITRADRACRRRCGRQFLCRKQFALETPPLVRLAALTAVLDAGRATLKTLIERDSKLRGAPSELLARADQAIAFETKSARRLFRTAMTGLARRTTKGLSFGKDSTSVADIDRVHRSAWITERTAVADPI
jgi:hypothetical protein